MNRFFESSTTSSISRQLRCLFQTLMVFVLVVGGALVASAQTATVVINTNVGPSSFADPDHMSVAIDSIGNVYVAGYNSHNVFKVTPLGVVTEVVDSTGDGGSNTLQRVLGLSVDAADNRYMVGQTSNTVLKLAPGGGVSAIMDATGDGLGATLSGPFGTATDSAGNVYVTSTTNGNVFRVDTGGTVTKIMGAIGDGTNSLANPRGIAVDSLGNVYVAGGGSHNVFKIAAGGGISEILDTTGAGIAPFIGPVDVKVDSADNVYVGTVSGSGVFRISSAGAISQVISSAGDGQGNTMPNGANLAIGTDDTLYVANGNPGRIFSRTTGGVITLLMDTSTPTALTPAFSFSLGLAVDASNNLWVTDRNGDRLIKYEPTLCGNGAVDGGETCDPSVADNACCNLTCDGVLGAATACTDDSNVCTDDVCDGASAA